jgi:hypothetical protein
VAVCPDSGRQGEDLWSDHEEADNDIARHLEPLHDEQQNAGNRL